jgi:hypothetical protein
MFDSNALRELAHVKADHYQRNGGGGGFKVYASSKAYDEARGYREMTPWRRLVYETTQLWRSESRSAVAGFKWDCHRYTLDTVNGEIPF